MRRALVLLVCTAMGFSATMEIGFALEAGNSAQGKAIAERWCSACHMVSPSQSQVHVDVPTFPSIARKLPAEADVLAAFLANPHPPMPNLNLTRRDIQDLLAYIATLK